MKKLLLTLILLAQTTVAEQIDVEYSRFYTHLKKIDKEELNALQFSFGFKKAGESYLCDINQATIVTQKMTIPLTIDQYHRFTLPTEKALKLANAFVTIDLQQPANQCDMSVQLETKAEYLKSSYEQQELVLLSAQYKQFFSDMGSFLSFMMPSSDGLKFIFAETPTLLEHNKDVVIKKQEVDVSDEAIEQAKQGLNFSQTPIRINGLVRQ